MYANAAKPEAFYMDGQRIIQVHAAVSSGFQKRVQDLLPPATHVLRSPRRIWSCPSIQHSPCCAQTVAKKSVVLLENSDADDLRLKEQEPRAQIARVGSIIETGRPSPLRGAVDDTDREVAELTADISQEPEDELLSVETTQASIDENDPLTSSSGERDLLTASTNLFTGSNEQCHLSVSSGPEFYSSSENEAGPSTTRCRTPLGSDYVAIVAPALQRQLQQPPQQEFKLVEHRVYIAGHTIDLPLNLPDPARRSPTIRVDPDYAVLAPSPFQTATSPTRSFVKPEDYSLLGPMPGVNVPQKPNPELAAFNSAPATVSPAKPKRDFSLINRDKPRQFLAENRPGHQIEYAILATPNKPEKGGTESRKLDYAVLDVPGPSSEKSPKKSSPEAPRKPLTKLPGLDLFRVIPKSNLPVKQSPTKPNPFKLAVMQKIKSNMSSPVTSPTSPVAPPRSNDCREDYTEVEPGRLSEMPSSVLAEMGAELRMKSGNMRPLHHVWKSRETDPLTSHGPYYDNAASRLLPAYAPSFLDEMPPRAPSNRGDSPDTLAEKATRMYLLNGHTRSSVAHILDSQSLEHSEDLCEAYLAQFNWEGVRIDAALRMFIKLVEVLPDVEARDRVFRKFSHRYHECNPTIFLDEDAAHYLTTAIISLNAGLHIDHTEPSMSQREFVSQLDSVSPPYDLSMLREIYDSIQKQRIICARNSPLPFSRLDLRPTVEDYDVQLEYKCGWVHLKKDLDKQAKRNRFFRRWNMQYIRIRGYILYAGKNEEQTKKEKCLRIPLYHALASCESNNRHQHVFRLRTSLREEYLVAANSNDECKSWVTFINFIAAMFTGDTSPVACGRGFLEFPDLPSNIGTYGAKQQEKNHIEIAKELRVLMEWNRSKIEECTSEAQRAEFLKGEQKLEQEILRYETYIQALHDFFGPNFK